EIVLGLGQTVGTAIDRHVFSIAVGHRKRGSGRSDQVDFQIIRDKEVQQPVPVVVHKSAAAAESRLGVQQAGLLRHIGESAIAVISIQAILAVITEKEILEAIVVVVSNANT